jgi:hypothetical protein
MPNATWSSAFGRPDVEAERVGEGGLVAVAGEVGEEEPLALADPGRPDGRVLLRVAHEVADGRDPADHLVDRVVDERGVVAQRAQLVGVPDERLEPARQRAGGRVVAGGRDDDVVADAGEVLEVRVGDRRGDVVRRPRPAVDGDLVEVGVEVHERGELCLLAVGAAEIGVLGAEELLRQLQHLRLVALRHSEHAHDDVQRVVERDVGGEVARAAELLHAVDVAARESGDCGLEVLPQARGAEPVVGDLPRRAVLVAVHVDERLDVDARRRRACLDGVRLEDGAARVPEAVVLLLDREDVGVARDGPERLDALDGHAVDRVLLAEACRRPVPLGRFAYACGSTKMRPGSFPAALRGSPRGARGDTGRRPRGADGASGA